VATAGAGWRLFLGLWPPAEVRHGVERCAASWQWPAAARRTPPANLHITLHFIGIVEAGRVPALREQLAVASGPCELLLDRAAVWPGGIAVLEASAAPEPLAQLHQRLAEALRALELPVETRRFRPHATLARKAAGARPPADFAPLRWPVDGRYLLLRSPGGGRGYEPLQAFG
jgi:2'-5' RNA ligase